MSFSVLIYAIGGYAVVFLAGVLVLERTRGPVREAAPRQAGAHRRLRAWPRMPRRCSVVLPLRSARLSTPPRRRRAAPASCRR